eukprot:13338146-Heterocapsa_arctica.AAC.1
MTSLAPPGVTGPFTPPCRGARSTTPPSRWCQGGARVGGRLPREHLALRRARCGDSKGPVCPSTAARPPSSWRSMPASAPR